MSEQVYDDEIAPLLMQAAKKAEAVGLPLVCYVQLGPDNHGRTVTLPADAPFAVRMVELAARCNGNADSFLLALIKHARKHGPGGSMLMNILLREYGEG